MNSATANAIPLNGVRENNIDHQPATSVAPDELKRAIEGCVLNDRVSQKRLYQAFYGYARSICNRYTSNEDDAMEIVNDGFLKVFKEIYRYKPTYADEESSFRGWLRKIMIYTAIDHFRKNRKHSMNIELDDKVVQIPAKYEDAVDRLSHEELLGSVQKLTPGYRTIFNLFVIEGFSHEEIAKELGITVGASKSSLAKGRRQLQKILARDGHFRQSMVK